MLRLNAYVMAADPAFLTESILSYYDLVDKIIVSYDRNKVGWLGRPIPVDECLEKLQALDRDRKMQLLAGDFYQPNLGGIEADTRQRQISLDAASQNADWVLQFDTDEVLADPKVFVQCLEAAGRAGCAALYYPMRSIFNKVRDNLFLEESTRLWQAMATYPGPVAIKPGGQLKLCRQAPESKNFHVDVRWNSTNPYQKKTKVDKVISENSCICHFTWVRSERHMFKKSRWSGHANDFDWKPQLRHWLWAKRHPYLATMVAPFRLKRDWGRHQVLRLTRIELPQLNRRPALHKVDSGAVYQSV